MQPRAYLLLTVTSVLVVILMDNGAMADTYYYRSAFPYRTNKAVQQKPISNSIADTYYTKPQSSYNAYQQQQLKTSYRPKPVQYKWKLDIDDSVEDRSSASHESDEVYRSYLSKPTYRRY